MTTSNRTITTTTCDCCGAEDEHAARHDSRWCQVCQPLAGMGSTFDVCPGCAPMTVAAVLSRINARIAKRHGVDPAEMAGNFG